MMSTSQSRPSRLRPTVNENAHECRWCQVKQKHYKGVTLHLLEYKLAPAWCQVKEAIYKARTLRNMGNSFYVKRYKQSEILNWHAILFSL